MTRLLNSARPMIQWRLLKRPMWIRLQGTLVVSLLLGILVSSRPIKRNKQCMSNPLVTSGTSRVLAFLDSTIRHLDVSPFILMASVNLRRITRIEERCVSITPQAVTQQSINRRGSIIWMKVAVSPFMMHSYPITRKQYPPVSSPGCCSLWVLEIEHL